MRTIVKWLTLLAPATLLLLLAFHYYNLPAVIRHNLPDSSLFEAIGISRPSPVETPQTPTWDEIQGSSAQPAASPENTIYSTYEQPVSIPDLWKQWSKLIYDARPQAPAISLDSTAQTARPDNDREPRTPYSDLVRNSPEDIESLQRSHTRFLRELANINTHTNAFNGTGVVMVGGGEYFGPAIIGIHMLRRTGSTLPVEVFVPNRDEFEKEICEQYLPRLNARCIVLAEMTSRAEGLGASLAITHYQLKAMALLLSSFSEVLLLDSDSIPIVDPEKDLFAVEPYTSKGLVIWPDFWSSTESPKFWKIAGLRTFPSGLPVTSSEAGQLLVNKDTHLKPLLLATYYNIFGPDYYYPLLSQGALGQGDKETFMAAAVVLNSPFYRVQIPVSFLGRHDGREQRGTAMVQHLPSDDLNKFQRSKSKSDKNIPVKPAFIHANTPKMNAGHLVDEGDLLTHDGKTRLRLLGPKEDQIAQFGYDLEKTIWELLVQTGCELSNLIREWKGSKRLCERLEEHFEAVFTEDSKERRAGRIMNI